LPNYFADVAEHRDLLRARLYRLVSRRRLEELEREEEPVIGVHVRLGDFAAPVGDLTQGLGRTPVHYFCRLVDGVRRIHGTDLPATVFSDGGDDELAELLRMPRVRRARRNADIVDLLLLSRSKVVIPAAWSTFSLWSAFLSDAPAILYPIARIPPIRVGALAERLYAGSAPEQLASWPERLVANIRAISPRA
jgi:hypothetical protein